MNAVRVAAIVGPTASGKTALSLEVAEALGAEIVSLDSMQIYRGMDIGTAKASSVEREQVRHHLIDIKEPSQDVTVAEFQALARSAIDDIAGRGRLPLLVGGSGLYFRAVVDDVTFPPRAPAVRAALEEEAERAGPEALHTRLTDLDPAAASKMEPGNTRRIVRALEVIEVTGRPFSDNVTWDDYESIFDLAVVGLAVDRAELYTRIERRVRSMIEEGLVDEVRRVAEGGMSHTARQALGYRQVLEAPDDGLDELAGAIERATKRFARRQESWFRADPRVGWIDASAPDLPGHAVNVLGEPAGTQPVPSAGSV
ncbi:MAG TPA: tRNA (adenosine(37)-N6)-dimethylallyltransferase MiaA [Actinomycetota bacterium]|nr:tRNA (adenosine(37)-N6)-dimethylallyltransferase MiaA [Actinomycetota bacterium]